MCFCFFLLLFIIYWSSLCVTNRKKAAQKEAYKLEHIQKELSKLDTLLTADVQVIRGKIEDASREYMDAQYVYLW